MGECDCVGDLCAGLCSGLGACDCDCDCDCNCDCCAGGNCEWCSYTCCFCFWDSMDDHHTSRSSKRERERRERDRRQLEIEALGAAWTSQREAANGAVDVQPLSKRGVVMPGLNPSTDPSVHTDQPIVGTVDVIISQPSDNVPDVPPPSYEDATGSKC